MRSYVTARRMDHDCGRRRLAVILFSGVVTGGDSASYGQNAYFYDSAEGLLTATILLVAEFCKPDERHIVSVYKIIQELLAPSNKKGKNQFQQVMDLLPENHKAKWFAGAALTTAEDTMASVMSTALSRLNAFLDRTVNV